ncbi:hypothetical protein I204_04111 [Kwoniella mangroviensis CBS 8886]|nr:hypothetical protein I204_04111 [Kwoniella mangroviensis CBS 8886]
MDPHGTWRASKSKAHLAQVDDTRSSSESSHQGWSGTEWNTSTNPRPSLSSSDEHVPPSQPSEPYGSIPSISHRRSTISRPSLHTVGSNISLDALNNTQRPNGSSGSAMLDINSTSPSPPSNGYTYGQPGPSNLGGSSSSYASSSYARSRRRETEIEMESEDENVHHPSTAGHPGTGPGTGISKHQKRGRGGSFSLPFHRTKRRLSSSLPWPAKWWPGGGGSSSSTSGSGRNQRKTLRNLLVILLLFGSLLWGISTWRSKYEIQIEFSLFSKKWIKQEIDSISSLKGCFQNPSPYYNMTKHHGAKRHMLNPGISLKRGMSCYDFSSTIQPNPFQLSSNEDGDREKLIYHTYWRSDLIEFGSRQITTFQSFLATQPLQYAKIILWTNGKSLLENNPTLQPYLIKWGEYIEVKQVDMDYLTAGTDLEKVMGNGKGNVFDGKGWVDGDAIRLLVLWHHGGIWLDMDQILTRDLHPLIEEEWVTQWDCYDKPYYSLNGALMHFERHSPYLCEAFHLMASSPFPKPNTFTWGSHLYSKLHRALLAAHIRPFGVLPWCFADPRNCRTDNRFPDPFLPDPPIFAGKKWHSEGGREELEERVGQVWSLHLHNQWTKSFPTDGWVQRLVDGYIGQLERLEIYARAKGLVGTDGKIRLEEGE